MSISRADKFAANALLNLKSPTFPSLINIIILDWDDTLFPTEYFKTRTDMLLNHKLIPEEINLKLRTLASNIIKVITSANTCGYVTIVSNASMGWLKLCFQVIPEIIPIMQSICVISAQDNFKHRSDDPAKWKEWTFCKYLNDLINQQEKYMKENYSNMSYRYNLISIGDSVHERDALKIYAQNLNTILNPIHPDSIFAKTIKLVEKPTFEKVNSQLLTLFHILKIENINYMGDEDFDFP
jgi:hypothetical protein